MPALPQHAARKPVPGARGPRRQVRPQQVLVPRPARHAHHLARHAAAPRPAEHGGVPPRRPGGAHGERAGVALRRAEDGTLPLLKSFSYTQYLRGVCKLILPFFLCADMGVCRGRLPIRANHHLG